MSDGLQITDTRPGTGPEARKGQNVTVHYTGWLYNNGQQGAKFDSSRDRNDPFQFPLGAGMVIKGWDEGVAGMKVGGQRTLIIPPDMGYGDFDKNLPQRVPLERFNGQKVETGMQFQAGNQGIVTVREVADGQVLLDGNHPLAGVTLNFEVEITAVRTATPDEVSHGHVHGPGGHHH
jgi:FKBP-type peptidyl-prolyl cis-trans isomerase FkpA